MKYGGRLFAYGTFFYLVLAVIYGLWSRDWAGTTFLTFTGLMAFIIAFYVAYTAKKLTDRPEDDKLANQDEADPDYGFFSPHSWWPLAIGFSATIFGVGFIFATWMMIAGIIFMMLSIVGLVFEYYRRDFAH